jgi:hypothetical protein
MELHDNDPDRLLGDKGYDSDNIRNDLAERGIEPVIPPRSNRKGTNRIRSGSLQAAKSDRALRQPAQAIPPHRHTLRENRQSLSFDAMYCVQPHLDQNCQRGLALLIGAIVMQVY